MNEWWNTRRCHENGQLGKGKSLQSSSSQAINGRQSLFALFMDSIHFSCFCFVFQFSQQKTSAAKCLNYVDFWEKSRMTKDEKGKDLESNVEKEEKDRKNKRHLCADVHLQLQLLLQN